MTILLLGLVLFIGTHSVRIAADGWRASVRQRVGEQGWKAGYSLLSLAGFVLIVWGYGQARMTPIAVWQPPLWLPHMASLLNLVAFILITAAYVPRNGLKARLQHPMVLGVALWAVAHLMSNGTLADLLLFGTFAVWAGVDFVSARQRDRAAGTTYPDGTAAGSALTVVVGVLAWAAFAFWAHGWLIGVRPFG